MVRFAYLGLLAGLALAMAGCVHDSDPSRNTRDINITPKDLLSFRQQAEADLVLEFLDWNNFRIEKPMPSEERYCKPLDKVDFIGALDTLNLQKRFAVVVMDKRWSIAKDRISLEEIETFLNGMGFQRVVIQQSAGALDFKTGLLILRDTSEIK